MSLQLRNEVLAHLAADHGEFAVHRMGWNRPVESRLRVEGQAAAVLPEGLSQLSAQVARLPRRLILSLAEDLCFMTTLPGSLPAAQVHAAARTHFDAALDGLDLQLSVQLAPGGQCWLAVAVESALLMEWTEQAREAGLRIEGVRFALGEDLWARHGEVPSDELVIAVLRPWGMSLVAIKRRAVVALRQERCRSSDADAVIAHIKAFAGQQGIDTSAPMPCLNRPVSLIPATQEQALALETPAAGLRWQLLPAKAALQKETL